MNIKVVSRNVGSALLVSALFMFISIVISLCNGHDSALSALLVSFVITFTVGVFPFIFVSTPSNITLRDGYWIVVLSWLLSFIFGMLPYILYGTQFSVIDAWFESVSGFTTTGATILDDIESLPKSLLFWRSSTHFIGGLGVVVFLLLVIPSSNSVRSKLTNMELSSLSKDGYKVRANKTVLIFAYVYLAIGLIACISYRLCGMGWFDAVNHAMSVCATGGFSTKNLSIGAFDSKIISVLTIVFMYLASIHFGLVFLSIVNRTLKPLNNSVLKYYTGLLAVASIVVSIYIKSDNVVSSWTDSFINGTFHVVSYASTTGFAIADNAHWPLVANVILLLVGINCGMAGSTTGGLKSDRVVVLLKSFTRQMKRALRPSTIVEVRVSNRIVHDDEVYRNVLYVALFFILLIFSYVVCLLGPHPSDSTLAGVVASISNVGPAMGSLSTYSSFHNEPVLSKLVYTFDMFLGRVEIYPILAVLMMIFGDRNK